jgi:hypothetical protein
MFSDMGTVKGGGGGSIGSSGGGGGGGVSGRWLSSHTAGRLSLYSPSTGAATAAVEGGAMRRAQSVPLIRHSSTSASTSSSSSATRAVAAKAGKVGKVGKVGKAEALEALREALDLPERPPAPTIKAGSAGVMWLPLRDRGETADNPHLCCGRNTRSQTGDAGKRRHSAMRRSLRYVTESCLIGCLKVLMG